MIHSKPQARKTKGKRRSHPRKMNTLRHEFDQILALRTPLPLIVIATYLNRLGFKESINRYVKWAMLDGMRLSGSQR
jgi:hypothetical protein